MKLRSETGKQYVPVLVMAAGLLGVSAVACSDKGKSATALPATMPMATLTPATRPTTGPATASAFVALNDPLLDNAHYVTDKIISGAQPEEEAAFADLQKRGIKTILSVDGATPNVALAHKYGMTYVHIPIGYDGVSQEQGRAISKALMEKQGPIYVHCHHGKHRSAAAVAVACVENGMLRPEQAESVLQTFGTGDNYNGLWRDARAARPINPGEIAALKIDFVETSKIADFAASMVSMDHTFENVKLVQKAGWKTPANHPDLDPPHEVLMLEEHFRESGRLKSVAERPEEFRKLLTAAEKDAGALHGLLGSAALDTPAADAAFKRVAASCTSCHKTYRD